MMLTGAVRWALWADAHTLDSQTVIGALQDLPNVHWVGVAAPDVSPIDTGAFAAKHEIAHNFPTLEYMFRSPLVDAVYITTHAAQRANHAVEVLANRKHVLVRPLGGCEYDTIETAADVAAEHNLVFSESHPHRHHPQTAYLDSHIGGAEFGELCYLRVDLGCPLDPSGNDPRLSPNGGGALAALMPSALSYVFDFAGEPIGSMRCITQNYGAAVDMRCTVHLETERGITVLITVALGVPHRYQVIMQGSAGTEIIVDDALLCRPGHIVVHERGLSLSPPFPGKNFRVVAIDPENKFDLEHNDGDASRAEFDHISSAILHDQQPRWTGRDAARGAFILDLLRTAVETRTYQECEQQDTAQ